VPDRIETPGEKLKNSIRKVIILTKAKKVPKMKLLELIEFIKVHKRNQA
jgi:hypothetical protein